MSEIEKYVQRARDMRNIDKPRDELFAGIDDMWHGNWELPETMKAKPDMREIRDLSPHDALKSGSAILSTSLPHWSVQPMSPTDVENDRAEKIEYAIGYNYRRMNQRGTSTVLWDMVHSCLRYDAVAAWVDYLPYQFGNNPTLRQKHALRKGPFATQVYSPATIHVQKDVYGLICVLQTINLSAQEVVGRWGSRADELKKRLTETQDTGIARFVYNDMMIYEEDEIKRVVWGCITSSESEQESEDEFIIMNEPIKTPFMPWVVRVGGSGLEQDPRYSVHPLLAPLYHTHKWKDLNVFQSIFQSEIIKMGRAPRVLSTTPSGDGVQIDYEDGSTINLRTGEEAEPWRPAPIDPNLKELVDRVRAEVSSATLPRILQNPEFAGNTPFASINAMIQTALGGLNPAKVLCEGAHEELALRMVEWAKFADKPLLAYRETNGVTGKEKGSAVIVTTDLLEPESIQIRCRLFAEAPTDFNQRLNAGILMNEKLKVPRSDILEGLGKENVDGLYMQYLQEQYNDITVMTDMQLTQQQAQMELQMQAQQAQMAMQQQVQAQQQQPGLPEMGEGGYPSDTQGVETGVPTGQGYNPNAGGGNVAAGNPGVSLREAVSGQDVTGAGI